MKLLKISLLFLTTFTFIACGGGSSGGDTIVVVSGTPAPKTSLSITDATGDEGKNITFKVIVNPNIANPITFDYRVVFDNSADSANASDFEGAIAGNRTIATNDSSTTIEIGIFDDSLREGAETFLITLSNLAPTDLIFTKNIAIGTIVKNDSNGLNTITITNARGEEGSRLNFQVTAGATITEQISFQFEATLDNNATNPANISELSGELTGTSYIATNDNSTTISILTSNDILREANETFLVILSDLSPTGTIFIDNVGRGTILDNDNNAAGIVIISIADAEEREDSGTINFRVSSKFSAISPFTFDYEAVLDNPISASTDDFTATSGTATIPVGRDSTTILIPLTVDTIAEPDETFSLRLTNLSSNATLDNNSAKGTILNDDLGEISNATAIVGDTAITLNWTNPNSNLFAGAVIAYQESSSTAPANCSSGATSDVVRNATSDTITGLTNDTAYSFRICAKSNAGSLSNGVTIIDLTPNVVDQDNDGLIEIADATGLYNIRHNLAGTSYKTRNSGVGNTTGCPNGTCRGYELVADINLSSFNDGTWDPIGSSSNRFTAIFDGKDKTISNLRITGNNSNVGLFSAIQDATISNLKLADVSITGNSNVGALVGLATGTRTTLSNIELIGDNLQSSSDAEIKGNGANVGGLVGEFSGGAISDASSSLTVRGGANDSADSTGGLVGQLGGSIKNSNSSGSVWASNSADDVGGLVGLASRSGGSTISNSWASGNVSSNGDDNDRYGGLVGENNGTISNSWASGNVSSNGDDNGQYGGLVGANLSGTTSNSWASGEVTGNNDVGGLVGLASRSGGSTISNSWASGNVSSNGDDNDRYGGLVGENNGTISNSWASGNVSSNGDDNGQYGGLVGANLSGTTSNSWASGEVTGNNDVGGLVGVNSGLGTIRISWASGEVTGNGSFGGLAGRSFGPIQGRNYRLSDGANSIGTKLADATALATLSGASGSVAINSNWHAGFNIIMSGTFNVVDVARSLFTRFCDTDGSTIIEADEQMADNSVWVMPPAANNVTTDTNEANQPANYYQIPAIRCIANTAGITDQTKIDAMRKIEIDRQRHNFPQP